MHVDNHGKRISLLLHKREDRTWTFVEAEGKGLNIFQGTRFAEECLQRRKFVAAGRQEAAHKWTTVSLPGKSAELQDLPATSRAWKSATGAENLSASDAAGAEGTVWNGERSGG